MVARDLPPPGSVQGSRSVIADPQLACHDGAEVGGDAVSRFLRVLHAHTTARGRDGAGVADLSARLRIERCALEEDFDVVTFGCRVDRLAVLA